MVNLEAELTDSEYKITKKGPNVKGSPVCAKVLKEIGVTDCGIKRVFDPKYLLNPDKVII